MKCSYISSDASESSEAVLFHGRYLKETNHFIEHGRFQNRHQKWVFFENEPPTNVWKAVSANRSYWNWFNVTATFTQDSDIPIRNNFPQCMPRLKWKSSGENYARGKSKMVVWFVSHCRTSSKRELYVAEMQKYLNVDIFGKCGKQSNCPRDLSTTKPGKCMTDLIEKDYKFYLSFENAICSEYITEKILRVIVGTNVIPVVLGGADYASILPKGSYIDIRDFKSVRELTEHLLHVDRNDTLYNQYISAKYSFHCVSYNTFMCDLCEYLHEHRYQEQLVFDAGAFWSPERRCVNPKNFFTDVAPEIVPKIRFYSNPELFI
ncbi:hypothetical protein CAPTEDRAFT_114059 [Capitella teleta]|uniref:Fucosyltransferase n=1 Tax=Capitella teleta TaxID=283909 RepID=R7VKD1_CAPTE|nr:hypothetical protein CAPTEDRAFT_114059 [Capitella teleta]|eukprot:ELU16665.1 hypothetical protein CAPTEDRAFT_114059 [Capitella teleta]